MTWHLIAVRTILPTLKSAREFCSKPRAPEIIASGSIEACYARAMEIGGSSRLVNTIECAMHGMPIFATGDWTYHVIEDKPRTRA